MPGLTILTRPRDTLSFAETVAAEADTEKEALGFLPESTYAESCASGRLFVAIDDHGPNDRRYAAHLLFGGNGSEVHIYQLFVHRAYRRRGIGRELIGELMHWAEARNYLGMAARVAADLDVANKAWDALGFRLVRKTKGGRTRGRTINLRHRELRTQGLLASVQSVGIDNVKFSVPPNVGRGVPTHVIDLNVLFDCLRDRGRRAAAQTLFGAAFSSLFRLVTTNEFARELERHTAKHGPDPLLELARAIPQLPYVQNPEDGDLTRSLSERLFPDRARKGLLTERDRSDISHLVVAIRSRAAGFVTSEHAILQHRDWIRASHGVDVCGVEEVVDVLADASLLHPAINGHTPKTDTFEILDAVPSDLGMVRALFDNGQLSTSARQRLERWLDQTPGARVVFAKAKNVAIAAVGWQLVEGPPRRVEGVVVADPNQQEAISAIDFLIETMVHASSKPAPTRIDLQVSALAEPLQQVLQDHAVGRRGAGEEWTKIAVGRPVDERNWPRIAHSIQAMSGLSLPTTLVRQTRAYGRTIECKLDDGRAWLGSVDDLEGLLSPVLLMYPGRPAAVVPIRGRFAEDLFGHLQQSKLFALPMASFRRERIYYTASQNYRLFARGNVLLFYESGRTGRQAIVAIARSLGARTIEKSQVSASTLSRGVLDKSEIKRIGNRSTVTAVSFDNVMMLPRPVTLDQLRANSWVPGHNFITTSEIESITAERIVHLGYRQ
jgi:GNAT superfamily N-acetyltransferase